ncbi:PaaI family thioesterase [Pseudodesulfovibrio sediminis]|uniref:Thioesterase n=1 Tax=Pseudodesulfovibrio sediminis TaxID=2810563 RepID=A0ABN6EQT1_9BACT|nr:PaaI family thioesterase [Pseudodesulfovibrio sediminis]BCS87163.1 thioesterase [Pseudodesulfovibrio sediminis]
MQIKTHNSIEQSLCGKPITVEEGRSEVCLMCTQNMAADSRGLVHGGFIFGLADYAAMLAVNHPNVVLGSAETRFLKPSRVGDVLVARAQDQTPDERKHEVLVDVLCGEDTVFSGKFICFVTKQHVLENA